MRHLFNLSFTIVNGNDAKAENPFTEASSDLLIVSVDTRLMATLGAYYSLVCNDEITTR